MMSFINSLNVFLSYYLILLILRLSKSIGSRVINSNKLTLCNKKKMKVSGKRSIYISFIIYYFCIFNLKHGGLIFFALLRPLQ